jgi:hypothetical protein
MCGLPAMMSTVLTVVDVLAQIADIGMSGLSRAACFGPLWTRPW